MKFRVHARLTKDQLAAVNQLAGSVNDGELAITPEHVFFAGELKFLGFQGNKRRSYRTAQGAFPATFAGCLVFESSEDPDLRSADFSKLKSPDCVFADYEKIEGIHWNQGLNDGHNL